MIKIMTAVQHGGVPHLKEAGHTTGSGVKVINVTIPKEPQDASIGKRNGKRPVSRDPAVGALEKSSEVGVFMAGKFCDGNGCIRFAGSKKQGQDEGQGRMNSSTRIAKVGFQIT